MFTKIELPISSISRNLIVKNSFWGIFAQVSQSILLSIFFVITAKKYSTYDFSNYIIVTVMCQLIIAFSQLGLGHWFIREISTTIDKEDLMSKFFKIQLVLGVVFYFVNIIIIYALYDNREIHILAIIFGLNIIFDNMINAIKGLNIAMFDQKRTFIILTIESILKFIIACLLFIYPFSILILTIAMIIVRFISLNLFLTFGSSNILNIRKIYKYKININDLKILIFANWPFIIVGASSVLNWRISTIIISKFLSPIDIANYEISYKLFAIAQILPIIVSSSIFPILIKLFNQGEINNFKSFYRTVQIGYFLFGLLSYSFVYSFANYILHIAFGQMYINATIYSQQMFLTMLLFPTVFLQANMLIAMKLEKLDMWINVITLLINVIFCILGLHYVKSLTVINFAIFISFLVFHILQDVSLFRKKISELKNIIEFYGLSLLTVIFYIFSSKLINPLLCFFLYWLIILGYFIIIPKKNKTMFFTLK
ncbi:oligosaccharide flippase family protein [Spirosoma pollinicola]|uniref:Polysaccharide biosynthesis protein n=1 Tax=Spirosoma pollinicola TaxID=2057025 RepID=A0A2K8ZAL1_9BACT|nr:oligosaccharide flippase family protein [Spirosoma pollinicola]AUD06890.1 hypothetical protein CWM47_36640 [Spirosoma pollinicola]